MDRLSVVISRRFLSRNVHSLLFVSALFVVKGSDGKIQNTRHRSGPFAAHHNGTRLLQSNKAPGVDALKFKSTRRPPTYMTEQYLASSADNKWSKNGYGQAVERDLGKFSREESETVRNAVQDYCSRKAISTARLCSECDHKAELKGAWMEIAKSIPHRTVQSVYRHGLRQLHPFKRGPWSEQEVATLHELIARMGKKWSAIQAKMNRSADSCRDKFREINSDYTKGYVCMCCLAITYVHEFKFGCGSNLLHSTFFTSSKI